MGIGEVVGILIFAIIINIILWSRGFYSKKKANISTDKSADPNAYKKGFFVGSKYYRFSREDLSDEERAKELAQVAADELLKDEGKE